MPTSFRQFSAHASEIRARAHSFKGSADSAEIFNKVRSLEDQWVGGEGSTVDLVAEIDALTNRLSDMESARTARSAAKPPLIEPSVSVTLWGSNADDRGTAYEHARDNLGGSDVTLVDRTPVETNELIGTRYVFRAVSA